jgi:hypothetical protein
MTKPSLVNPDDLDILCAIWILSCNDENPVITYRGINYRLGLQDDYDVRSLVRSRGEMFRRGVSLRRLQAWKQAMRTGKHQPSWIRHIEDVALRDQAIGALTSDDVFRNQFRSEESAPPCVIEIVDWGLKHIDRIRTANLNVHEERVKRLSGIWVPLLSTIVAITAILVGAKEQMQNAVTQAQLTRFQVTFKTKQEGYALFMRAVAQAYAHARSADGKGLNDSLDILRSSYFSLEPFLNSGERQAVWDQYEQFAASCNLLSKEPPNSPKRDGFDKSYFTYEDSFREQLFRALFERP